MNVWLDGYHMYGINVIMSLFQGNYAEVNKFPYLTFCNLTKKELTENNEHSFVCLLSMNIFYEKLFTLFWFYLLYVAIVTVLNAIGWFTTVLRAPKQAGYVKRMLRLSKTADFKDSGEDAEHFREFVNKFLKPDGVFVFQMINRNTSTIVMQEVIGRLWVMFKAKKHDQQLTLKKTQDEAEAAAARHNELYPTL
jgi:hypothetical protein